MLAVLHGASPDSEMFASDRFMPNRPWKGHLPAHISCLRKVRHSWPLLQWMKPTASLDIPMVILPSLQQLRFLCALAEPCHFGRAAESCAVTQSTLSGGIKELEARLGVTLFERSHRHNAHQK